MTATRKKILLKGRHLKAGSRWAALTRLWGLDINMNKNYSMNSYSIWRYFAKPFCNNVLLTLNLYHIECSYFYFQCQQLLFNSRRFVWLPCNLSNAHINNSCNWTATEFISHSIFLASNIAITKKMQKLLVVENQALYVRKSQAFLE